MPTLKYDFAGRYRVEIILEGNYVPDVFEIDFVPTVLKPRATTVESLIRKRIQKIGWDLKIKEIKIKNLSKDKKKLPLGLEKIR